MFATALKNAREAKSFTMQGLADFLNKKYNLNISKSQIYRWENGQSITMNRLFIIAYELEISLDSLATVYAETKQIKK